MRRYTSFQRLTSVLVTVALLAGAFLAALGPAIANDEVERIPVGPDLTAVLLANGTLTFEGSGRSDDFDPVTDPSPLTAYADRITALDIPDGVTGLGNYLFYGCYGLTGSLVLPAGLLELGNGVFSGPDAGSAPHFTYIFNEFTSLEEVVPVTPAPSEDGAPAGEDPTAAPPAEVTAEPTTEPTTEQTIEPTVEPIVEPTAGPTTEQAIEPTAEPTAELTAEPTAEPTTEPTAEPTVEPTVEQRTEPTTEPTLEPIVEPTAGPTTEQAIEPTVEPTVEQTAEPTTEQTIEPTVEPTVEPTAELTAEPTEEPTAVPAAEPTAEPDVGPVDASTPEPDPEPVPTGTGNYEVKPRYTQIVGEGVFYPAADGERAGLFLCTMENISFLAAAAEAGYALADGELTLHLVPGEREGKVVSLRVLAFEGQVTAPECPAEFASDAAEGEFLGWLVQEGETLYAPGDSFPVDLTAGEAVLCAFWSDSFVTLNDKMVYFEPGLGTNPHGLSGEHGKVHIKCAADGRTWARWPDDGELGFKAPEKKTDENGDHFVDESGNKVYAPTGLGSGYATVIVFDGWSGSDGQTYDPGDLVPAGTMLTAKWAWAVVGYVSSIGGEGTWTTRYYLSAAMNNLQSRSEDTADKYRNIIVVDKDAQLHECGSLIIQTDDKLPALACTVTGKDPVDGTQYSNPLSMDSYVASNGYAFTRLTAPMIMHDITLKASHTPDEKTHLAVPGQVYLDGFYANCNKLIMGKGKTADGKDDITVQGTLNIFGGAGGGREATETDGSAYLTVFSGKYQKLYGGSFLVSMNGGNRTLSFLGGETDYLYGGGYQKGNTTTGVSEVYMTGGTINYDLAASSDQGVVNGNANLTMVGGTVKGNVYGGVYGAEGNTRSKMEGDVSITIYSGAVVNGNVHGGGNISPLTGNTAINIMGGTVVRAVFGGGNKAAVTGSTSITIDGGTVGDGTATNGNVYGGGSAADVAGKTSVTVTNHGMVYGSIYGAGSGAEKEGTAVGGAVTEGTALTVSNGGMANQPVYGGGEGKSAAVGSADAPARIEIRVDGGTVNGNLYGGGSLAPVYGNISVAVSGTTTGGVVSGNVYGGGHQGEVAGNTDVTVTAGGTVGTVDGQGTVTGGFVFGGGLSSSAVVTGDTRVTVSGGTVRRNVYGGGHQAQVKNRDADTGGNSVVTVTGGTVEWDVFGGGVGMDNNDGIAAVTRSTTVTIEDGTVRNVYGGASKGNIGLDGSGITDVKTTVNIRGGTVVESVYGGGFQGKVGLGVPDDATKTSATTVNGSTTVNMTGGQVGESVYGGGYGVLENMERPTGLGVIYGDCTVNINGGTVGKHVFGGSNIARITGNTVVNVISSAGDVAVGESVYGGSNSDGSSVEFKENLFLVYGNSTVTVRKDAHGLTIDGSILGSGNLTKVYGTRTLTVEGLSGKLASLKRANTATIKDCELTLTGGTDIQGSSSLNYSMSRIDAVRLVNSNLTINTEFLDVKEFGSYTDAECTVEDMDGRSSLAVMAGWHLDIGAKDPDTGEVEHGKVSGVTRLIWTPDPTLSEEENKGKGVFVHAKAGSNIGDSKLDETGRQIDTGAFIADPDQEMPVDESLRSGETQKYSYWQLGGSGATVRAELTLTKKTEDQADENGYYSDSVEFHISKTMPAGTEFEAANPDLSYFTALLTEYGREDCEQALKVEVVNNGPWGGQQHSVYVVSDSVGVIHNQGTGRPVTVTEGQTSFRATFYYKNPEAIATGVVLLQLRAYEEGNPHSSRGIFTLELTIKGTGNGTATGRSKAGRQYAPFNTETYVRPIIATDGTVSAQVKLSYTALENPDDQSDPYGEVPTLTLRNKDTGQQVDVSPYIMMADLFTPLRPRWYVGTLNNGSIKLNELNNVRGLDYWAPPKVGELVEEKSILFLVDFRDAGLPEGNYYLSLEFPERHSCVSTGAVFQVVKDLNMTGGLTWSDMGTTLKVEAPAEDPDYADGALVRLTGLSGETAKNVTATVGGVKADLLCGDGAIFLRLPQLTQGKSTTVTWKFPEVEEETTVKAELFPLPVFQSGGTGDGKLSATADPELKLTASGGGAADTPERAMVAELAGKPEERLVDRAAGGTLSFKITLDQALGDGESVTAEIWKKTGADPTDSSYTEQISIGGWTYTAGADGLTGTGVLTVPGNLEEGTYRVCFKLQDKDGADLARCSFNFIVR